MPPQKVNNEVWAGSVSRKMLYQDIIEGTVTNEMKPRHVRQLREEYQQWNKTNFGSNLATLRSIIARDYARMRKDKQSFIHDMEVIGARHAKQTGQPIPWHRSIAKNLLNAAIDEDDKLLEKKMPLMIYNSKEAYREFTLVEFRNHIYQELKKREKIKTNVRFVKK